jgi:hypothetical protein
LESEPELFAVTFEDEILIAPILESPELAPAPIPAPSDVEIDSTDTFTIESDEHEPPSVVPIPAEFELPVAKIEPPEFDVSVTFDSDEHSTPPCPEYAVDRNEFEPSAKTTTELPVITSGVDELMLTFERRMVREVPRIRIPSAAVPPVIINVLTRVPRSADMPPGPNYSKRKADVHQGTMEN